MELTRVEETARTYYNSDDAEEFYSRIWGGEDIHIGLYSSDSISIADASRATVENMARFLPRRDEPLKVLDLGAGYGGAARFLAMNHNCQVDCLNLSEAQNERNRLLTGEQGLDAKIRVFDGSFEEVPFPDASYDVVWSQDAFLHSGRRELVIQEAARVLKPGGHLIFTDIMQTDDCPQGVLEPILNRIHLETLGSPAFYKETTTKFGLDFLSFEELTAHLVKHYSQVLKNLQNREEELAGTVSLEYMRNMQTGLEHWINGGQKGYLCWGVQNFQKK